MVTRPASVEAYLASLPPDRREAVDAIRDVILANLDPAFEEGIQYGMIGYYLPHSAYPAGYHCDPRQPLPYAGLASQKNHLSMYIMMVYGGGSIKENGEVLGTVIGVAGLSMSGGREEGSATEEVSGFYEANAGGSDAVTLTIVSPTGKALVLTKSADGAVDAGVGTASSTGANRKITSSRMVSLRCAARARDVGAVDHLAAPGD